MMTVAQLRWLSKRGIGLHRLSTFADVPSELAFAVARKSPNLFCLHINYSPENASYMKQLEACCPHLQEVRLHNTSVESRLLEGGRGVAVELVRDIFPLTCCLKARCELQDWHRKEPSTGERGRGERGGIARRFKWQNLLLGSALMKSIVCNGGSDEEGLKNIEIAKEIISSADSNDIISAESYNGWTALMKAALCGQTDIIKLILDKDKNSLDIQNLSNKQTALMEASSQGRAATIEQLIRAGANTNIKNSSGKTAFDILDSARDLSFAEKARLRKVATLRAGN
jgi:hypothetical protein